MDVSGRLTVRAGWRGVGRPYRPPGRVMRPGGEVRSPFRGAARCSAAPPPSLTVRMETPAAWLRSLFGYGWCAPDHQQCRRGRVAVPGDFAVRVLRPGVEQPATSAS